MAQKFNINGKDVEVEGAKNLLHGCLKAGVEVPHYCWHPGLSVVASCRLCLVEAGTTDPKDPSKVAWQPKLVPACQTPVAMPKPAKEGEPPAAPVVNYIKTNTEKVIGNQKHVMEYLLINHPLDCPVCDQAGECLLQDFSFKYGNSKSRFVEDKQKQPKKDLGPTIMLFTDRCILCSRCVRFDQEISGKETLSITNRGNHCEIDIFPDAPLDHKMSGNVGDLCPVGALEDKDFLYKQRVWFLKDQPSVCGGCSAGCSTWTDANPTTNVMWRMRPRTNLQVNQYWMCDEGRYGWKYVHAKNRLLKPVVRKEPPGVTGVQEAAVVAAAASVVPAARELLATGAAAPARSSGAVSISGTGAAGLGVLERQRRALHPTVDWSAVLHGVREGFRHVVSRHGAGSVAAVISPFASNEEAYLLAKWVRGFGDGARVVVGPIPVRGEAETFKSGFTIRPEKCPNRKGVEAVATHFGSGPVGFETLRPALDDKKIKALFVLGGYPDTEVQDNWADELRKADFLVVQDILAGKLTDAADVVLAGASFAEREGSWVNFAGIAQHFDWAFPPPAEARRDGQILADLMGRAGLFHAGDVLAEMAGIIPAFAEAKGGQLGAEGVKLAKLA